VKKLLITAVALAVGALVFSKVRSSRDDADLWHEATR
jgi:hypothetical protein